MVSEIAGMWEQFIHPALHAPAMRKQRVPSIVILWIQNEADCGYLFKIENSAIAALS